MSAPNQKGLEYTWIDTINPDEKLLCTFLTRSRYEYEKRPLSGSKYRDYEWREEKLVPLYGDWTHIRHVTAEQPGDEMSFTWARNWTPEEKASPVPFRSTWNNEAVDWPHVLERLPSGKTIDFTPDPNFPFIKTAALSEIRADRINVDWALRDPYPGESEVRTDMYLSPHEWDEEAMLFELPMPQPVQWNQTTSSERNLPSCLHDEIIIPALGGCAVTVGSDPATTFPPSTQGKVIPPTNFITWEDHWCSKKQARQDDGTWLVIWKWAKAPDMPPIVTHRQ